MEIIFVPRPRKPAWRTRLKSLALCPNTSAHYFAKGVDRSAGPRSRARPRTDTPPIAWRLKCFPRTKCWSAGCASPKIAFTFGGWWGGFVGLGLGWGGGLVWGLLVV